MTQRSGTAWKPCVTGNIRWMLCEKLRLLRQVIAIFVCNINTLVVVGSIQRDEAVNTTTATTRVGQGSASSSDATPSSSSSSPVNAERGTAYSRMTG